MFLREQYREVLLYFFGLEYQLYLVYTVDDVPMDVVILITE